MWDYGNKELIHNEADLRQLVADYGVRYFAVQEPAPNFAPIQKTLREFLAGPDFELIERVPIKSNIEGDENLSLALYLNRNCPKARKSTLTVPMMTLDHDIEVPFR